MALSDFDYDEFFGIGDPVSNPVFTQPTTSTSTTGGFNSGISRSTYDWGGFATNVLKLVPNILSAGQGHAYASGPYGQSSYPQAGVVNGQGVAVSGNFLGASGFGSISGTTLILIGLGVFLLLKRK